MWTFGENQTDWMQSVSTISKGKGETTGFWCVREHDHCIFRVFVLIFCILSFVSWTVFFWCACNYWCKNGRRTHLAKTPLGCILKHVQERFCEGVKYEVKPYGSQSATCLTSKQVLSLQLLMAFFLHPSISRQLLSFTAVSCLEDSNKTVLKLPHLSLLPHAFETADHLSIGQRKRF